MNKLSTVNTADASDVRPAGRRRRWLALVAIGLAIVATLLMGRWGDQAPRLAPPLESSEFPWTCLLSVTVTLAADELEGHSLDSIAAVAANRRAWWVRFDRARPMEATHPTVNTDDGPDRFLWKHGQRRVLHWRHELLMGPAAERMQGHSTAWEAALSWIGDPGDAASWSDADVRFSLVYRGSDPPHPKFDLSSIRQVDTNLLVDGSVVLTFRGSMIHFVPSDVHIHARIPAGLLQKFGAR